MNFPGYLSVMTILIDFGADINAKNSDGNTALHTNSVKGNADRSLANVHGFQI